ncbi:conserved hypothetical protein [Candidatus Zixiibacteriota bacterium]|nr:conserved hypothetical protein [candidate division Zixibacteria bacterium]
MERRDFIKKTGQALALAAITGGTGFLFHNREKSSYTPLLSKKTDYVVPADSALPALTSAHDSQSSKALNKALDGIGGIKRFVKPGERVTIKPNIGWDRTPAQAANTNPELVAEMVRLCLAAGAASVIVSDISCNDPRRCFLRSGIREAAEKAGAKVILPSDENMVKIDLNGKVLNVWPVLRPFLETDRLINMPIVKQHSLTSCTIGLKNLYGVLGGRRNQLHQDIDQSLVDLMSFFRPTLTVVDATHVLMRGGPQGGSFDDVKIENTVMCASDPVAADARACEFLGLTADRISHIVLAAQNGLGNIDFRSAGYKEII